jgi:hypothetical protein
MGVQLITDDRPPRGRGLSGHHPLHMSQEIGFSPSGSTGGSQKVAGHNVTAQNERARAMPYILKLAPLDFSRSQRQPWMFAFQRLHPGQLIGTHRSFSLLSQPGSLLIHRTHLLDRFFPLWVVGRRQPVSDHMRLESSFFKRRVAWRGEMRAIMPRVITSSASSRPLQWLMGRSLGCSQARAIS